MTPMSKLINHTFSHLMNVNTVWEFWIRPPRIHGAAGPHFEKLLRRHCERALLIFTPQIILYYDGVQVTRQYKRA